MAVIPEVAVSLYELIEDIDEAVADPEVPDPIRFRLTAISGEIESIPDVINFLNVQEAANASAEEQDAAEREREAKALARSEPVAEPEPAPEPEDEEE